jgi:hypothetical protein
MVYMGIHTLVTMSTVDTMTAVVALHNHQCVRWLVTNYQLLYERHIGDIMIVYMQ